MPAPGLSCGRACSPRRPGRHHPFATDLQFAYASFLDRAKDLLDVFAKEHSDLERQWKTRIVLAVFDHVDGLAAYAQPLSQFGLAPAPFRAQHAKRVSHRGPTCSAVVPATARATRSTPS